MINKLLVCVFFVQCNLAQELLGENDKEETKDLYFQDNEYLEAPRPGGFDEIDKYKFQRDLTDVVSQAERPATEGTNVNYVRNRRGTTDSKTVENTPGVSNLGQGSQLRSARMLLQDANHVQEGFREPRGATKEQWVKQPYPVHDNFDDSITSSSDVKAPRVHFVTQRRLEAAPPAVYRTYEREGRSREAYRDGDMPRRTPSREYYPLERSLKRFEPYPPRSFNPYRDDAYYRYEESRYDPRYGSLESERPHTDFPTRQRRIIYYATLPEVVRTPPNVNLRNRYVYRDRYDDRYPNSPSLAKTDETSYRFRKPPPYTKSRYEQEIERTKAPYPLKVSTDVNVRETKKNPERRIYSEPDSQYAYKAQPYQSKETFEQRS